LSNNNVDIIPIMLILVFGFFGLFQSPVGIKKTWGDERIHCDMCEFQSPIGTNETADAMIVTIIAEACFNPL